jgi:hypothetical protein
MSPTQTVRGRRAGWRCDEPQEIGAALERHGRSNERCDPTENQTEQLPHRRKPTLARYFGAKSVMAIHTKMC